jgi:predicted glycosyltransferase
MKILFGLGHPAHFHLFKHVISELNKRGHSTNILIKKKDILVNLLKNANYDFSNMLPNGRMDNRIGIALGLLKRFFKMFLICFKNKPDLLIGTSVEISYVGKLLGIPSINANEDDADIVPLYSKLAYPPASEILSPEPCNNGKWESKSIKYAGYHELAYLHPDIFKPDRSIVQRYFKTKSPYFIIRFAKFTAHHDQGINGINSEIAGKITKILEPYGRVFITSERELELQFEKYRMMINPLDMHHLMYFASMYIGDSQTMAAEAGMLGTPFIRCNDFVDRIGYLKEIEVKYKMGYGIRPNEPEKLINRIIELLNTPNLIEFWQNRRKIMISEKINVTKFMVWFIENYPSSARTMKENPDYQYRFRSTNYTEKRLLG